VVAQGPVIPEFERASECIRQNKQFCFDWFVDNFDRVFVPRLGEHIKLTAIAVGIGLAISFTAALLAYSRGWFETPFAIFAAFLYTIPSLAFFQLMVPITGLSVTSAEIALVS
jgi:osmoprotectant transport system permease protein